MNRRPKRMPLTLTSESLPGSLQIKMPLDTINFLNEKEDDYQYAQPIQIKSTTLLKEANIFFRAFITKEIVHCVNQNLRNFLQYISSLKKD